MGLDMYLFKYPRYKNATAKDVDVICNYLSWKGTKYEDKYTFEEWCGHEESEIRPDFLKFYTPHYITRYPAWDTEHGYGYKTINEEIGYWRKSNQIHNWFVNNVQNGIDDCGSYEVDEYQLQKLLDICKHIVDIAIMGSASIKTGYKFSNGTTTPIYGDGEKIVNAEEISKLLPTTSGFFFGGTDYDNFYMDDIKQTINILEKVLEETDFEKEAVVYSASW